MLNEFAEKMRALMQEQSIVTQDDIYSYLVFIYEQNDGAVLNYIYYPGTLLLFKMGC